MCARQSAGRRFVEIMLTEETENHLGTERFCETDGLAEDAADISGLYLAGQEPVVEEDEDAELHNGEISAAFPSTTARKSERILQLDRPKRGNQRSLPKRAVSKLQQKTF